MKVAAIQMVSGTALDDNLRVARELLEQAALGGAELAVLPEYFCLMGYKDTDKLALRETAGAGVIQQFLADAARALQMWIVGGTLPMATDAPDRVRNTTLVFDPAGACVARYDKIHLFGFTRGTESYNESRTIVAGAQVRAIDTPFGRVGLFALTTITGNIPLQPHQIHVGYGSDIFQRTGNGQLFCRQVVALCRLGCPCPDFAQFLLTLGQLLPGNRHASFQFQAG